MLISKGLPEELIEKAKSKFIEIQEAYEELEKKQKNDILNYEFFKTFNDRLLNLGIFDFLVLLFFSSLSGLCFLVCRVWKN